MMRLVVIAMTALAGAALVTIGGRTVTRPELKYFKPSEFGVWYPFMSAELLLRIDSFREKWGAPVVISDADGALGRHDGEDGTSQHNIDKWGEVRAVDFFPMTASGRYINTPKQLARAYQVAVAVGFTGVGVYTDTQPGFMLHGDVRPIDNGHASWSRINGNYYGVTAAWV
ncbi:hypothetical protein ACJJI5_12380 [Microbulbifer sp. EKSA008]|uniref:hypothetical protein n=1 Tax=Microbulbifer sp. EKSA008 TaxID=3243367 RepID=UPI0040429D97